MVLFFVKQCPLICLFPLFFVGGELCPNYIIEVLMLENCTLIFCSD